MHLNFNLLHAAYEQKASHFLGLDKSSPEEYPTLLHFAASTPPSCPSGGTACGISNCASKTPAELADMERHNKLVRNIMISNIDKQNFKI